MRRKCRWLMADIQVKWAHCSALLKKKFKFWSVFFLNTWRTAIVMWQHCPQVVRMRYCEKLSDVPLVYGREMNQHPWRRFEKAHWLLSSKVWFSYSHSVSSSMRRLVSCASGWASVWPKATVLMPVCWGSVFIEPKTLQFFLWASLSAKLEKLNDVPRGLSRWNLCMPFVHTGWGGQTVVHTLTEIQGWR